MWRISCGQCVVKTSWNKLWNQYCVCNSWVSKCVNLFRVSFSALKFFEDNRSWYSLLLNELQACNFRWLEFLFLNFHMFRHLKWDYSSIGIGWLYEESGLAYTDKKRNLVSPFYRSFSESPQNLLVAASLPAASGVTALAGIIAVAGFPSVAPTCQYMLNCYCWRSCSLCYCCRLCCCWAFAAVVHRVLLPVSRDYLIIHREHIDCQSIDCDYQSVVCTISVRCFKEFGR